MCIFKMLKRKSKSTYKQVYKLIFYKKEWESFIDEDLVIDIFVNYYEGNISIFELEKILRAIDNRDYSKLSYILDNSDYKCCLSDKVNLKDNFYVIYF